MILLIRHYIAAKTSSPGKVYMHLVLQTAVPTMKQGVQKPETTAFINLRPKSVAGQIPTSAPNGTLIAIQDANKHTRI